MNSNPTPGAWFVADLLGPLAALLFVWAVMRSLRWLREKRRQREQDRKIYARYPDPNRHLGTPRIRSVQDVREQHEREQQRGSL